jgi:hypothetical protein
MAMVDPYLKEYFYQGSTLISIIGGIVLPSTIMIAEGAQLVLTPIVWIVLFFINVPVIALCISWFVGLGIMVDPAVKKLTEEQKKASSA